MFKEILKLDFIRYLEGLCCSDSDFRLCNERITDQTDKIFGSFIV